MSLADQLLADFDSDEDDFSTTVDNDKGILNVNTDSLQTVNASPKASISLNSTVSSETPNESNSLDLNAQASLDVLKTHGDDVTSQDLISRFDFTHISDITSVSNLMTRLSPILDSLQATNPGDFTEYSLLVDANSYSIEIDNEIIIIHQFIKEHYQGRFPELETLVPNPVLYAKTVLAIGNNVKSDFSAHSKSSYNLKSIVPSATLMMISMAAFESKGKDLSQSDISAVKSACELLLKLNSAKEQITMFVSERLPRFAPNLTAIVGAHTAAQLLGVSGGLKKLASTPSSNIPALGSKSQIGIGFGHTGIRQRGLLYHSSLVQDVPPEFRSQAIRIISGKLVLAARIDLEASLGKRKQKGYTVNSNMGEEMRKQIIEKIEKILEPPENKAPKALPVPIDKPSKKRAGKKIRKFKEQFEMTELQKANNRIAFGADEVYDDDLADLGGTLGSRSSKDITSGSSNTNRIRAISSDNKTKAKMSKSMSSRLHGRSGNTTHKPDIFSNGMYSSLSSFSSQGIELMDPSKNKTSPSFQSDKEKWFKNGAFTMIEPKSDPGLTLGPNAFKKRTADFIDHEVKRQKQ